MENPTEWPELQSAKKDYDSNIMKNIPKTNLTLKWYTHSYLYFDHYDADLYQRMSIDKTLIKKSLKYINNCKAIFSQKKKGMCFHLKYIIQIDEVLPKKFSSVVVQANIYTLLRYQ